MTTDAQPSGETAAATAAARMRALPQYEREWMIVMLERDGKLFDLRHIWRGGLDARLQEGIAW